MSEERGRRLDRVLAWTGDPPGRSAAGNLVALRSIVLVHWATQAWAWSLVPMPAPVTFPNTAVYGVAIALTGLVALSLFGRGRLATLLALPLVSWAVAWLFPFTANHGWLAWLVLAFFALLDPDRDDEATTLLQALRWAVVIVFFWAGVQKLLHGMYFRGEFLAWMIANGGERWPQTFGPLLPAGEVERLQSYGQAIGSGPFRPDSLLFVLASNAVWIGEIGLALGMLWPRTRQLAALGAIGLTLMIQSAPREFMFAALYSSLLLLFVSGDWIRRLLYFLLLFHALLLAAMLGLPGGQFLLKAGGRPI